MIRIIIIHSNAVDSNNFLFILFSFLVAPFRLSDHPIDARKADEGKTQGTNIKENEKMGLHKIQNTK